MSKENDANNWKTIWSNKGKVNLLPFSDKEKNLHVPVFYHKLLQELIYANGFETKFNHFSTDEWIKMISEYNITKQTNDLIYVLEVGSGSGASILPLWKKQQNAKYFGVDYSFDLLRLGEQAAVTINAVNSEAAHLPLKEEKFDVVYSHSVFQYFSNRQYAEFV